MQLCKCAYIYLNLGKYDKHSTIRDRLYFINSKISKYLLQNLNLYFINSKIILQAYEIFGNVKSEYITLKGLSYFSC